MAFDYFATYSLKDKLDLLRGVEETIMTGQVVRVKTSRDSETQFNPNVNNELTHQRLCQSILRDPGFDPTDPDMKKILSNRRANITRARFC